MTTTCSASPADASATTPHVVPGRALDFSALGALFWLALRQHVRARRLLILAALFLLPAVVAVTTRAYGMAPGQADLHSLEFALVLTLMPQALVPLTCLLYASGMIQDEIEEQTLTYLLIRPLPKWAIYLTKLLATLIVTLLMTAVFSLITFAAIYVGSREPLADVFGLRWPCTTGPLLLAAIAYCSLFGCMSLLAKRSLVAGVTYIVLFEGLLAKFDFAFRRGTVMYYFRVLTQRWLVGNNPDLRKWGIGLDDAPDTWDCLSVLLGVSAAATVLAAMTFTSREFRLKTPEGS
jgi:ABC-2 type transport system permease protein